jgi:tetratricopeptide (TPR) repeat protein
MHSWFGDAYGLLVSQLGKYGYIDGFAFLQDYYLDNEESIIEECEVENAEDFASSYLESFQAWAIQQVPSIAVSNTGRWSFASLSKMNSIEIPPSNYTISEDEEALLQLQDYQLTIDNYEPLKDLVSRFEALGDERVVSCSIKLAKAAEKVGKRDLDLVNYWSRSLEFCKTFPESSDLIKCYQELAYYYMKVSKYKDAAETYKEAAGYTNDSKLKMELLRDARIHYQNCGDHDSASDVFVSKMNIKRNSNKLFLYIFWFTSNYGESPKRVLQNIFGWIFLLSLALSPFMEDFEGTNSCFPCKLIDSFYYTMVTFTTLGYGDITPNTWYWKILSGLISFLGLLYTSMLMVTIVRKYSRS